MRRASLLVFSKRISDAVEEFQQGDGSARPQLDAERQERARYEAFEAKLRGIQLDLLTFRNMYWFHEVSNQIQCQELFDLQSKHLRTRELFDQVFDEAERAGAVVSARQKRMLEVEERLQTEYASRLGVLAAALLVAAPMAEILFVDAKMWWGLLARLGFLIGVLMAVLNFSDLLNWLMQRLTGVGSSSSKPAKIERSRRSGWIGIGLMVVGVVLGFFSIDHGPTKVEVEGTTPAANHSVESPDEDSTPSPAAPTEMRATGATPTDDSATGESTGRPTGPSDSPAATVPPVDSDGKDSPPAPDPLPDGGSDTATPSPTTDSNADEPNVESQPSGN